MVFKYKAIYGPRCRTHAVASVAHVFIHVLVLMYETPVQQRVAVGEVVAHGQPRGTLLVRAVVVPFLDQDDDAPPVLVLFEIIMGH